MHSPVPMIGNTGTNGTRNPRSRSGLVRRRTMIPMFTSTKANRVPMFTSLAISASGTKAARVAMSTPNSAVRRIGVLVRSLTLDSAAGNSPSRDIAKDTRV